MLVPDGIVAARVGGDIGDLALNLGDLDYAADIGDLALDLGDLAVDLGLDELDLDLMAFLARDDLDFDDFVYSDGVARAVVREAAARGATILFSSHQLELVEDLCVDVAIINGTGGLVEEINLRTTVLRSLDGTVHIFPNGTINTLYCSSHGILSGGKDMRVRMWSATLEPSFTFSCKTNTVACIHTRRNLNG